MSTWGVVQTMYFAFFSFFSLSFFPCHFFIFSPIYFSSAIINHDNRNFFFLWRSVWKQRVFEANLSCYFMFFSPFVLIACVFACLFPCMLIWLLLVCRNYKSASLGSSHLGLCWNKYQSSVFEKQLENRTFFDVTLAEDEHVIEAHQMVLSAFSANF